MTPGLLRPTGAAAFDFVRRWWGGSAQELPTASTAGTSAAAIMKNDPRRVAFIFYNLSANNIWIAPDVAGVPSSTNGMFVGPNGGWVNFRCDQDGTLPAHGWSAVAAAGGSSFLLMETLITGR